MRFVVCFCLLAACATPPAHTDHSENSPDIPDSFDVAGGEDGPIVIAWRDHAYAATLVGFDAALVPGVVTDKGDGTLVWDPQGALNHLSQGQIVTYQLPIQLSAAKTLTASISITGANDAPTAASDSGATNTLDALVVDVLANDSDPDTNDTLTISAVTAPSLGGTAIVEDGKIRFTPGSEVGTYTFTYTLNDGSASTSALVEVVVRLGLQVTSAIDLGQGSLIGGQRQDAQWVSHNASGCTLTDGGTVVSTEPNGVIQYAPQTGTLTLTCQGDGGPAVATASFAFQRAIFVDDDAPAGGDGKSWTTAFPQLQDGVNLSQKGARVWVKEGRYVNAANSAEVLAMTKFVEVYGGFSQELTGTDGEIATRPRNSDGFLSRITLLDGAAEEGNQSEHVVLAREGVLDGLTIAHGRARHGGPGPVAAAGKGGGLYASDLTGALMLRDVHFDGNQAGGCHPLGGEGGAVYATAVTDLKIIRCRFTNNSAKGGDVPALCDPGDASAGAVSATNSTTTIEDSVFSANLAQGGGGRIVPGDHGNAGRTGRGGAVRASGTLVLERVSFDDNAAKGGAGSAGSAPSAPGGGYDGADGGRALGGAVFISGASVVAVDVVARDNRALGGEGGDGGHAYCGDNICGSSWNGGGAGRGGDARGGVVHSEGTPYTSWTNLACTSNTVVGGHGGDAGDNTINGVAAEGGHGGEAAGGCFSAADGGIVLVGGHVNANQANAGSGGNGGYGTFVAGGAGGSGAEAHGGGGIYESTLTSSADISGNSVTGGPPGAPGGGSPTGATGPTGYAGEADAENYF